MLAPQILFKGLVSRVLPGILADGPEAEKPVRLGRYGDIRVEGSWPSSDYRLADEGAYMVANMLCGATALQLGLSAAFSATACPFVLVNSDSPGGKRIYPRRLRLCQVTAPQNGVDLRYAIVLDNKDRSPTTISNGSGGTGPGTPANFTAYRCAVICTNQDLNPTTVGIPYFPISTAGGAPPTIPAAGPFARTIVGNGYIKSSIPVVKDDYCLQFGSCDTGGTYQGAAALSRVVEHAPPIVIGPGQTMLIYLWSASNSVAGNAWDDVSLEWVEK